MKTFFTIVALLLFAPNIHAQNETKCNITIMDSGFRDIVYDINTWKNEETNADEIERILAKEIDQQFNSIKTSPSWQSTVPKISQRSPALIIINIDSFLDPFFVERQEIQENYFMQFLRIAKANGQRQKNKLPIIVYSNDQEKLNRLKENLQKQASQTQTNVHLMLLESFENPSQVQELKSKVLEVLEMLKC